MQAAGEQLAIVSTIDPQTVTSMPQTGDYVDMSKYHSVAFFFALGDMAAETIDASVLEATSSAGAGAQALKAATQLAAHASNNDLKQIVIEVNASDLTAGFRYVAPKLVTGSTTGGPASCVGLAYKSRNNPASDGDLASVVQIKR
ncbi:MAG: hypothetical protein ACREVK_01675 [Gammaproteobacteria bacterium]